MSDRDIALDALRELAQEATSDEVRLEAAQVLLHSTDPDYLAEAAEAVVDMEDRLAAVERAVGSRRLSRAEVKT